MITLELKTGILELRNKSIPKQVNYFGDGLDPDGNMVYDMAECPNCGCYFEEDGEGWNRPYCFNCGQKLKW